MDAPERLMAACYRKTDNGDELFSALERLTKTIPCPRISNPDQSDYDFAHQIEEKGGVHRRYRGNATPVADGYSTGA